MKLDDVMLTGLIALGWIILYVFNHWLFKFTEVATWVSLVFIPAGFKVASALIFRFRAIIGLFLGAFTTGFIFLKDFSFVDVAIFSLLSCLIPFVTIKIVEMTLPFHNHLSNFSVKHVLSLGAVYAVLNAFTHVAYRYHPLFLRDAHETKEFLSMATGDLIGIFLFMYVVAKSARLLHRYLK